MGWLFSFACGARPWSTLFPYTTLFRSRGSARQRRFALLRAFPWFSGLFSKHRTRMIVILEPLRRSHRYRGHVCCLVTFRGRMTLQTPRNVEERRRNELSGTQKGGPLACRELGHGMAVLLCLWSSAMVYTLSLHDALPISGVGQAASVRPFEGVSLVFGAFLEAPNSYDRDS